MANDVAWYTNGGFKPQAPTFPLVLRNESRIYDLRKSCDWLLLVLAPLTKIDGKVDDGKAFGLASKSIQHVIVW